MKNNQYRGHRKALQSFILVGVMIITLVLMSSLSLADNFEGKSIYENNTLFSAGIGTTVTNAQWTAMCFTVGVSGPNQSAEITGLEVYGWIPTGSSGLGSVRITNATSSATGVCFPHNNTLSVNNSVNWNNLDTTVDGKSFNITLPAFTQSPGKTYAIVMNSTSSTTVRLSERLNSNTYTGGNVSFDEGSVGGYWVSSRTPASSLRFKTFGDLIIPPASSIIVNLNVPTSGYSTISLPITFNASVIPSGYTLTNATLFVYNSTTYVANETNTMTAAANESIWSINLPKQGEYTWNVYGCGNNVTGSLCSWSSINKSFTYGSIVNSVTYNNNTYDSAIENFILNFSTINPLSINGILNYNGVNYTSTASCVGTTCILSNQINIPAITTTQKNNSFYWMANIFDGSTQSTFTSSSYNQTVTATTLTQCTQGIVTLNFTAWDEQNRTRLKPFSFDGTFDYSVGSMGIKKHLSITNWTENQISLCINVNTTYYLDAIIAYSAMDSGITYSTRNYFYQNYQINNQTQNVSLFLLKPTSSTSFVLSVLDRSLVPLKGVLVEAQKCYPGYNDNQTVFKSRTDSNGLTTGNFEAETALYKFLITNNSQTLLAVSQCSAVVPQTAPYTLTFKLGDTYISPFININNLTDITKYLVYNHSTGLVTLTYIDTSGIFNYASLLVKILNYSGNTLPTVCSSTSNLSSGIITCNVSTSGSYTATAYVYRTGETLIDQITFTVQTLSTTMGYYGVFLGFFIILICAFAFKFNEIAGIWLVNAGVIFCNFVGLIAFGNVFITAMLCVSIIITGVLER